MAAGLTTTVCCFQEMALRLVSPRLWAGYRTFFAFLCCFDSCYLLIKPISLQSLSLSFSPPASNCIPTDLSFHLLKFLSPPGSMSHPFHPAINLGDMELHLFLFSVFCDWLTPFLLLFPIALPKRTSLFWVYLLFPLQAPWRWAYPTDSSPIDSSQPFDFSLPELVCALSTSALSICPPI